MTTLTEPTPLVRDLFPFRVLCLFLLFQNCSHPPCLAFLRNCRWPEWNRCCSRCQVDCLQEHGQGLRNCREVSFSFSFSPLPFLNPNTFENDSYLSCLQFFLAPTDLNVSYLFLTLLISAILLNFVCLFLPLDGRETTRTSPFALRPLETATVVLVPKVAAVTNFLRVSFIWHYFNLFLVLFLLLSSVSSCGDSEGCWYFHER